MKATLIAQFIIYALLTWLGIVCINYDLSIIFGRTIPTFWAFVLTFFTGNFSVVLAIVLKVLVYLHVIVAPLVK